jgi:hypothetical protein
VVQHLHETYAQEFPSRNVSDVTEAFSTDESFVIKNDACASTAIATIDQYVQLTIPAVEDGNNFGVGVQLAAVKVFNDQSEKLDKCMEDLIKYASTRADALEKCKLPNETTTKSSTTSTSDSSGTSAEKGDTSSNTKSQSTEEKTVETSNSTAESTLRKQSVIAVDVRFYEKAKYAFMSVISALLIVTDFVDKNKVKIAEPKGDVSARGYSGSMY